ncbi:cyclic peptide export ABC transporter [Acidisoma cellulosilytica]|uniref:Cyclic peptide export ABC transporter n=1 Tax=Acidisoma cellulosilyticum TaxID=2802395 RepID=A0A963Z0M1_9PROT|nr:cyclic peptide export ABC transporter [Acidisoma cellulosilyticum]MCB8880519.1 cyclic peptide export ABC transporter [Acidisoma cellulosilyticum]
MTDQSMNIYRESLRLLRPFWPITLAATIVGAIGGIATAWLLAEINRDLHSGQALTWQSILRFLTLCLLSTLGSAFAGIGNSILGQRLIGALRKDISARILAAPLAELEQQRSYRLMAVLTSDVDTVSAATFALSGYGVSLAIVIASFVYLLHLSALIFALAAVVTGLGVVINILARRAWQRDYEHVRTATDDLQKQFRALTEGAKELRLSRARRSRVHDLLLSGAADRITKLKTRAMGLFWIADTASSGLFFVAVGILLLAQNSLHLEPAVISGAVLVLLYARGPVGQIANGLPTMSQAQVSLRRIATLSADFADQDREIHRRLPSLAFDHDITLRGVRYDFTSDGATGFVLGPIDLTIHRGETMFLIGGNGSGKTTLIKLLLGLYRPTAGSILVDGTPLPAGAEDAYRQLFSAVFSDYFLFDDLTVADKASVAQANDWLDRLEISHKVTIRDGQFSTTDLSTGQRKRLALIHAYLEDRPIMMFDEWAADQDPTFRRIFYTEILAELKAQGKTLIVISHDDRYFHLADRVLKLDSGLIVDETTIVPAPATAPEMR